MKANQQLIPSNTGKALVTAAIALGIAMLPLAACGNKASDDAAEPAAATQDADAPASAITADDIASWKTLGDALANRTGDLSYGYDEELFVCVFDAGETKVRVVAQSDPSIGEKLAEIEFDDPDYDAKTNEALANLQVISAEDITDGQLSQEELDAYVGKTGQDLLDAGFVFSSYSFYGGEETGVTMDYGNYSYDVTFDVSVPEEKSEDGGESIKGATVVVIDSFGNLSDAALNPEAAK